MKGREVDTVWDRQTENVRKIFIVYLYTQQYFKIYL